MRQCSLCQALFGAIVLEETGAAPVLPDGLVAEKTAQRFSVEHGRGKIR